MDDKKLFEISCRETLLEIVKNSDVINKKLSFTQKILLFDKITMMPFHEVYNLVFQTEDARDIETKDERDTKYGAAATIGALAVRKARGLKTGKLFKGKKLTKSTLVGAAVGAGLLFIYRRMTDPCFKQTMMIPNERKRKIAKLICQNNGIAKVINKIRSDIPQCNDAPNPSRCKDKLSYELNKWRSKHEENTLQLTKLRSPQD